MTAHQPPQVPGQLELPLTPELPARTRTELVEQITPGWADDAACAGTTDPDAFHPDPDPDSAVPVRRLLDATDTCAFCPVAWSCLAAALVGGEHGIWGRTTETQRVDLVAELAAGGDVDAVLDRAVYGPMADLAGRGEWRKSA